MKHRLFSKYLKAAAWFCSFCFFTVAIINLAIDLGKIDPLNSEKSPISFVTQLVGSNHGLFFNTLNLRDIRRTQALYPTTAECAVIGSSRIWQISSARQEKSLTNLCSSILNLGTDGGTLEDYLALSKLILGNKRLPKTIIFGIDPWSFNFNRDRKWRRYATEYESMKSTLIAQNESMNTASDSYGDEFFDTALLQNLLNRDYFMNHIRIFLRKKFPRAAHILLGWRPMTDRMLSDGSLIVPQADADRIKKLEVNELFISWANSALFRDHYYDKDAINLFTRLVLYLQQRFNVVLMLTPYNPWAYDSELQPFKTAITLIEPIVHRIAKSSGAQVIGSYNPHSMGCKSDEFYDAVHPLPKCTMKLETLSVQYKTINKKQLLKSLESKHAGVPPQ